MSDHIEGFAVRGMPHVVPGDDLGELIWARVRSAASAFGGLQSGDVVVVTSKIVSRADTRIVETAGRDHARARRWTTTAMNLASL